MITLEREQGEVTSSVFPEVTPGMPVDTAVALVSHRATFKQRVHLEGSPIYLYPSSEEGYESQAWDHPAFLQGWHVINRLIDALPEEKITPFVLVDEFNNIPHPFTSDDYERRVADLFSSSETLQESPVARGVLADSGVVFRHESDFLHEDSSFNVCSNLDARFQKAKITHDREDMTFTPEYFRDTLIVIAHPTEFKQQQSLMLAALLGDMKGEQFQRLSKVQRRALISEMFVHIWIDETGNIESTTRPFWDGNKFIHEELI